MPDIEVDPLFGDAVATPAPVRSASPQLQAIQTATPPESVPAVIDIGHAGQGLVAVPPAQVLAAIPKDDALDAVRQSVRGDYAAASRKILETHKAKDADQMGEGINQLLMVSKGLNPKEAKGFLNKMMARVRSEKEQILANTQSVQKRLDELTAVLDQTSKLMKQRVQDLEAMKQANIGTQQKVRQALAQFTNWEQMAGQALAAPVINAQDIQEANDRKALQRKDNALKIGIEELKNGVLFYEQFAQELQATQDGARDILDQYDRVKNNAIPALTNLVSLQLIALEQKQALATDQNLRDITQMAITEAAKTLGENEVQIATAQQSSVISVDDLTKAQDILDEAAQKVKDIQAQGELHRQENEVKRKALEQRLLTTS
ncbi:hypothetical protein A6M27_06115 [Acidithiobacillus thiooxidans]|uniref:toxic anion resistance protein n=1 Tax=Acidithiobacillus thiooxidans TaxID=930 RepID=UPI0004669ADC|nr:toxic anion resistance protein [Acidithiobacillus thiooxidans]OCX76170.1 hypothetical protein A6O24_09145 [Acidithiobacillus thiooxidans]OCX85117.1 hypothetical protein A6O26_02095 [Acidithiobacillus thiooxidans]OCX88719.1 hypothetical protein A6M27_06115 [Acidithiobacillus thiooxidans]OFC43616.1 hypothetical protein BAE47_12615 [Acidithiobacillus thiooxidans]